jgi:tryptophan synthase alpha chain
MDSVNFAVKHQSGIDGVILPDLPLDEYKDEYHSMLNQNGMLNILLITPTTSDDRIRKIDSISKGFIYAISSSSTTGTKNGFSKDQERYFERIKAMNLENPFLIGFGVSSNHTFSMATSYGAGAIIGSAFIKHLKEIEDLGSEFESEIKNFIQSINEPITL